MWFNSVDFLIFLITVLPLFFVLGAIRSKSGTPRIVFLVGVSCFFYMWWNPPYIILLFISMVWDYSCGMLFLRWPRDRWRWIIAISVMGSLTILIIFKYGRLFYTSFAWLMAHMAGIGLPEWRPEWGFVLPAGLSFYTFQTMSYCIDVYRGKAEVERSFYRFSLFIVFFPHLVAGPIVKARDLLPQYRNLQHNRPVDVLNALEQIAYGLFKKVAVADSLAMLINPIFDAPHNYSGASLAMATIFFSFQIYCDFSGYTDIAIGVAKLFGVRFPRNFLFPYFQTNIQEFWHTWHMSLSSWLREYLYISLGGNRKGKVRTYANLLVTMLLGGLWHGASWNFLIWGFLHGIYLAVHRFFTSLKPIANVMEFAKPAYLRVPAMAVGGLLTFSLVTLSWIPFRLTRFGDTITAIRRIFSWAPATADAASFDAGLIMTAWFLIAVLLIFDVYYKLEYHYWENSAWTRYFKLIFPAAFLLMAIVFGAEQAQQFIYFQF